MSPVALASAYEVASPGTSVELSGYYVVEDCEAFVLFETVVIAQAGTKKQKGYGNRLYRGHPGCS